MGRLAGLSKLVQAWANAGRDPGESSAPLVVVPGVLGLLKRAQHLPVDVLGLGALAVLGADVVPTAPDGKPQGRAAIAMDSGTAHLANICVAID